MCADAIDSVFVISCETFHPSMISGPILFLKICICSVFIREEIE